MVLTIQTMIWIIELKILNNNRTTTLKINKSKYHNNKEIYLIITLILIVALIYIKIMKSQLMKEF